uniref:C2H2-type domain-containing protein n=1 Tax=Anopheles epiroticus TaxID=199890 RepID=A0A182PX19_9DIPT
MNKAVAPVGSIKCIICMQCATTMVPLDTKVDISGIPVSCETMYGKLTGLQYDRSALGREQVLPKLCLACLPQLSTCYLFQQQAIDNFFVYFAPSNDKRIMALDTVSYDVSEPSNTLVDICPVYDRVDSDGERESYDDSAANASHLSPSLPLESVTAEGLKMEAGDEEEEKYCEVKETAQVNADSDGVPTTPKDESIELLLASCKECTSLAEQYISFRKHFVRAHLVAKGNGRHECTVCSRCFKSRATFVQHIRVHTGSRKYACGYCPTSFYYLHHLRFHELSHTKERPFVCDKCPKAFTRKYCMLTHRRVHQTTHPHMCPTCKKRFKYRSSLRKHKHDRSVANFESYQCERCGKELLSRAALTRHTQQRTCDNAGTTQSKAANGKDTNQPGKHQCDACGVRFKQKIDLARHKLRHEGKRPFRCDICDATFTQKGTLTTHMRTHTGEKPFQCTGCDERFRSAAARRSHVLRNRCPKRTSSGKS